MLNFLKRRTEHPKQNRSKLFYDGAHDSYGPQKMSVSDSLQALEPRIMFDAAGVATGAEVAADQVAEDQAEQVITENLQAQAVNQENEQTDELIAALADVVPPADRNEVVFIDKGVEDYQSLLSAISSDAELVFIESNSDGLEQIANILQDRNDIDAIHIISHGDSGELFLGNSTVTQESIQGEHADELATIKAALNEEADILIYGCNFAEGEQGKSAADALAEATGADVAASEDLTGAESLGGDWDLEYEFGNVGTVTISGEAYEGILAPVSPLVFAEFTEVSGDGDNSTFLEGEVFRCHNVSGDGIDANTGVGAVDALVTIELFDVSDPSIALPTLAELDATGYTTDGA